MNIKTRKRIQWSEVILLLNSLLEILKSKKAYNVLKIIIFMFSLEKLHEVL
jgi:hypothetical protein